MKFALSGYVALYKLVRFANYGRLPTDQVKICQFYVIDFPYIRDMLIEIQFTVV